MTITIQPGESQKQQKNASIEQKSLLAEPYVPLSFRALTSVDANILLSAVDDTEPHIVGPLAPVPSRCFCAGDTIVPQEAGHPVPYRHVLPELYYPVRPSAYPELVDIRTKELPKLDNDISQVSEYRSCMEQLLLAERECLLNHYGRYSQYNVAISVERLPGMTRLGARIRIGGIADANPPLQPGDIMLIRPNRRLTVQGIPGNMVEIHARIQTIEKNKKMGHSDSVHFHWLPPNQQVWLQHHFGGREYNIRFVPSSDPLERCLTALDWIGGLPDSVAKDLLFPDEAPFIPVNGIVINDSNVRAELSTLNNKQSAFVRLVLGRTRNASKLRLRGPIILTGPAGTGKTKTLLLAMRAVLSENANTRILVCTPSHAAADVITRRLAEYLERSQLFRLYDAKRPVETVPVDVLPFACQSAAQGIFTLPPRAELMAFRVIVCTCTDAHILYRIGLTNAQLRVKRQCFQRYVMRECQDTNLRAEINGVDALHFSHFFMDEAAQASEAESLIPLSVVVEPGIEIVLVGDPRQLSPEIYSVSAAQAGFSRSWMERLLLRPVHCLGGGKHHMLGPDLVQLDDWLKYSFQVDGQEQLSIFLTLNYRGHPSSLMMPSALFYADKLTCIDFDDRKTDAVLYWCDLLRQLEALSKPVAFPDIDLPGGIEFRRCSQWPIHCRAVDGTDSSVSLEIASYASNSWVNLAEAEAAIEIALTLAQNGVSTQAIGVMAPFRGQVALIRRKLRERQLGGINVGTIEDYQAVQRDVIILSLTRSTHDFVDHDIKNRMGVFGQPKRSNVALTRAESLLVVIGSPLIMAKDLVWKQFLMFCFRNHLLYGDDPATKDIYEFREGTKVVRHLESELYNTGELSDFLVLGSLERILRSSGNLTKSTKIEC